MRAPAGWKTARLRFSSGGNEHSAASPDAEWSTSMLISRSDLAATLPRQSGFRLMKSDLEQLGQPQTRVQSELAISAREQRLGGVSSAERLHSSRWNSRSGMVVTTAHL